MLSQHMLAWDRVRPNGHVSFPKAEPPLGEWTHLGERGSSKLNLMNFKLKMSEKSLTSELSWKSVESVFFHQAGGETTKRIQLRGNKENYI